MDEIPPRQQGASTPGRSRSNRPGRWLSVAVGDAGDALYWKAPYKLLESVRSHLCELEDYGEENAGLAGILEGLPIFKGLLNCPFPPLYRESDFDEVTHMRVGESLGWRENRWTGFSAVEVKIYIWSTKREAVFSEARILDRRLVCRLYVLEQARLKEPPKHSRRRKKKQAPD